MNQKQTKDPQVEIYRRMAPWQRLEAACQLYWFAREIIKNRERLANPNLDDSKLEQKTRSFFK